MAIGHGKAFLSNGSEDSIAVGKSWQEISGLQFLVESVPLSEARPFLETLQAGMAREKNRQIARHSVARRSDFVALDAMRSKTRSKEVASIRPGKLTGEPGWLLDYQIIISSQTNYTFKGDTTYYISADVYLYGATTIEGGTVIKYTNSAPKLMCYNGPVSCLTSDYRPAVLTAKDDDTVGETIAGSTGTPSGAYAQWALQSYNSPSPVVLEHLRISYATYGALFNYNSGHILRHSQFVNVSFPVYAHATTLSVQNVLIHKADNRAIYSDSSSTINAEHLTVHEANRVWIGQNNSFLNLTNSLLVSITNWDQSFNGAFNATNTGGGVFTAVGGGGHYLADNTYRNVGTTNISASLLADFKKLTTYPPIVLTNDFTVSTTLSPQAQRDADLPDLGFHYSPLDYCWSGLNLSNANLTLTNGVAVGIYGTNGTTLRTGAKFISEGTPVNLNHLVRYQAVQEQPIVWGATANTMSLVDVNASGLPELRL